MNHRSSYSLYVDLATLYTAAIAKNAPYVANTTFLRPEKMDLDHQKGLLFKNCVWKVLLRGLPSILSQCVHSTWYGVSVEALLPPLQLWDLSCHCYNSTNSKNSKIVQIVICSSKTQLQRVWLILTADVNLCRS